MSFSSDVRNELARVTGEKRCCHIAELAALMRMGGAMIIGGNSNLGISFTTENAAVARKVLKLLKQGFDVKTEIMVSRALRLKKNNSYMVRVPPSALVTQLLATLGIDGQTLNVGKDSGIMRKICCRRAYLRGAFLGGGSVNRPEGDYHLELVTGNLDFAKTLVRLLRTFHLSAGLTDRKNDYIVYLKDGDAIGAVLQIIGAHDALMTFENVRVMKEMRNQVNRLVNCETANLQKTVNAAVRQLEAIRYIETTVGLGSLSGGLRETAELRLKYPEASLQELERVHSDQVSKSGINHRLRKVERIYEKLRGNR